jgi:hypothetical protein
MFRKESSDFSHERDGDFYRVVRRSFEEEDEHLKGENFVGDLLIH